MTNTLTNLLTHIVRYVDLANDSSPRWPGWTWWIIWTLFSSIFWTLGHDQMDKVKINRSLSYWLMIDSRVIWFLLRAKQCWTLQNSIKQLHLPVSDSQNVDQHIIIFLYPVFFLFLSPLTCSDLATRHLKVLEVCKHLSMVGVTRLKI